MSLFDQMSAQGFGGLHLHTDADSGLKAVVAVHSTRLGPSLGGCRCIPYADEASAVTDCLRLARGMTYKAALAGLPHGGGKSVIMCPSGSFDRRALFSAFGQFVESLGGRYITAEDSGTSPDDMAVVREHTAHVTGVVSDLGGGDPSPYTALGVRCGIEAAVEAVLDRRDLEGVRVLVQGVGNVGFNLCRELTQLGARVWVADLDTERVDRARDAFGVEGVPLAEMYSVECEVYAPCALGGAINDESLPKLKCAIVAGAANNQLTASSHGDELRRLGIFYAPDYAINAGGLISVADEVCGYDPERVRRRTLAIRETIMSIAERAKCTGTPPHRVADELVERRLEAAALAQATPGCAAV